MHGNELLDFHHQRSARPNVSTGWTWYTGQRHWVNVQKNLKKNPLRVASMRTLHQSWWIIYRLIYFPALTNCHELQDVTERTRSQLTAIMPSYIHTSDLSMAPADITFFHAMSHQWLHLLFSKILCFLCMLIQWLQTFNVLYSHFHRQLCKHERTHTKHTVT